MSGFKIDLRALMLVEFGWWQNTILQALVEWIQSLSAKQPPNIKSCRVVCLLMFEEFPRQTNDAYSSHLLFMD